MGLLANADVHLLSDKWRKTANLITLTICVTVLGLVSFWVIRDLNIVIGTLGLLFIINRKPIGLNEKKLFELLGRMKRRS